MAKYIYKNAKNTSIGYILFKLNWGIILKYFLKMKLISTRDLALLTNKLTS